MLSIQSSEGLIKALAVIASFVRKSNKHTECVLFAHSSLSENSSCSKTMSSDSNSNNNNNNNNDAAEEKQQQQTLSSDNNNDDAVPEEELQKEAAAAAALPLQLPDPTCPAKRSAEELAPETNTPQPPPKTQRLGLFCGSSSSSLQIGKDIKGKGKQIAIDEEEEKKKAMANAIFRAFLSKPKGVSIGKSPDQSSSAAEKKIKQDDLAVALGAAAAAESIKAQGKGSLALEAGDFLPDDQIYYTTSEDSSSWEYTTSSSDDTISDGDVYNSSGWEAWPGDNAEHLGEVTSSAADAPPPTPPPPSSSAGTSTDKAAAADLAASAKKNDNAAGDPESKP